MKKTVFLVLAVMLILASLSFAQAEGEREAALFEVLEKNGGDLLRISSAVPVADNVVIAPAGLLPEDQDSLFVSDGAAQWQAKAVIPDETGSIAIIFYDSSETPARYGFWQLLPWGNSVPAGSCRVRSINADGAAVDSGVMNSEVIRWKGQRCLILSLTDPVPAGSSVLTENEQLAGIVIAEWAEGVNRVLMLPTDAIAMELSKAAMLLGNLPGWKDPPEGLKVTLQKNLVTVDWTDMALPDKADGETLYMVLVDLGNNYLNFYPAETESRSISLLLTPGRFYMIGPAAATAAPENLPDSYAVISVPPAKKLTEYSFHPVVTAIAKAPVTGLKENEKPEPVTEITEELLRSNRSYFYSHSTYNVIQSIYGKTLLVTLTDPDGVNYTYESSWIYMPEYNEEDIWFLQLKESGLTEGLNRNGYPAGTYRMAFYVDGDLADSFEFELK